MNPFFYTTQSSHRTIFWLYCFDSKQKKLKEKKSAYFSFNLTNWLLVWSISSIQTIYFIYIRKLYLHLGPCSTTNWIGRYQDNNNIRIRIRTLTGNTFTATYEPTGSDPNVQFTGTLNEDCTGTFDGFGVFGGAQAFVYNSDTCSITVFNTGNVYRSRSGDCTGISSSLKHWHGFEKANEPL